jgi:hypothetical protein
MGRMLVHPATERHSEADFKDEFPASDKGLGGHPFDQADGFYE